MVLMSFTDSQHACLLDTAWTAIRQGVREHTLLTLNAHDYEPRLQTEQASFVTLYLDGQLRGCIGALYAYQPLILDVAQHAYAAALQDPRFAPVTEAEIKDLSLHISVLSLPEPLHVNSEAELYQHLRPHQDGLILEAEGRKSTFLPAVWESLPEPSSFMRQLKLKAGLPPDYWSASVKLWRYHTESVE